MLSWRPVSSTQDERKGNPKAPGYEPPAMIEQPSLADISRAGMTAATKPMARKHRRQPFYR